MALLTVEQLKIKFRAGNKYQQIVDGVDFSVRKGEVVCMVGESGCGKSVTALSLMRLHNMQFHKQKGCAQEGKILFHDVNLMSLSEKDMRKIRGNKMAMIFQDPLTALNPLFTVKYQMGEVLKRHLHMKKKEAYDFSASLLEKAGIRDVDRVMNAYPHTLSGGMRQRVMIAMALSCDPDLLIADEPTTALDVTVQMQILECIKSMQKRMNMAVLMITHDFGVVAEMADRVLVFYMGQIVEEADVFTLFSNPLHPYTKSLIGLVPNHREYKRQRLEPIKGCVSAIKETGEGCRFRDRCSYAGECFRKDNMPPLVKADMGHKVRCWQYETMPEGSESYGCHAEFI